MKWWDCCQDGEQRAKVQGGKMIEQILLMLEYERTVQCWVLLQTGNKRTPGM